MLENGKPLHCVELVTGNNLTGTLLISDKRISTQIYSYSSFFFIKGEEPIILQTETNDIVTLHSNITNPPGKTSRFIEPKRSTYRQDIVSNFAVVGHDPWTVEDEIKRTTFRVRHTEQLMRHQTKVKAIGGSKYPKDDHFTIFTDAAEGMILRASYFATYGMEFDAPKELWPTFEIEFNEPSNIGNYIAHVSDYVSFLSFCFGVKLKPSIIHVDRLSLEELKTAVEKETYLGDHAVHYVWPEKEIDNKYLWLGSSPVLAQNDKELASLRACLVAWMNRSSMWNKSYALMMASFELEKVISAERLINACRWLEDIPIAQTQSAISDKDIENISAAAATKAEELGHSQNTRERIAGAIKWLKAESAEKRFTRLVAMVESKFGTGILSEDAVAHLKRALQFRGRVAHGHFAPENDAEFRAFSKSTHAMEALCYLLTAFDLPISKEGITRIRFNRVVEDYRRAYE